MEAFMACQIGRVFASLGCLLQVRQCFSIKALSETLMIFIWWNCMVLSCISLFFPPFLPAEDWSLKGYSNYILPLAHWYIIYEDQNFCFVTSLKRYLLDLKYKELTEYWILPILSTVREDSPVVNLPLPVFELRGLKERGIEAEDISIIEYLVSQILFL